MCDGQVLKKHRGKAGGRRISRFADKLTPQGQQPHQNPG